ncbi:type II toxin-antitoxin system VapC family toxin [Rhizobium tumorigenes]|uniref:type II toxin-antitoxin system VapC family toxin n=1 Tax=Rhizobium tumorigenes TaxID=2041385 RepID=UPI003BF953DC
MTRPARVYLDTNIFIALVEQEGLVPSLLRALIRSKPDTLKPYFATSELTFSELVVRPYRDRDERSIFTYNAMLVTSSWLEVGPVDRSVLRYAAILRADHKHLKLPDAIHISTAMGCGCSHLLTADLGIRSEYELSHDQHGTLIGPISTSVLRPDEPTLTSLLQSLAS